MGKEVGEAGMMVRLFDEHGKETSSRFYAHGRFTGKKPPPGVPNPGSDDWLHDIYLADSDEDLQKLVKDYPAEENDEYTTSGSSLGARLIISENLNGVSQVREYKNQYVIATNLDLFDSGGDKTKIVDTLMASSVQPWEGTSGIILPYFWKDEKLNTPPG